MSPELFNTFARYNTWMNAKIYGVCSGIPDETRREDRGAFFRSIHGTLGHLMFGDMVWMNRLAGSNYDDRSPVTNSSGTFEAMKAERVNLDRDIEAWTTTLTPDWLSTDATWLSHDGQERTQPRAMLTLHMFNHQTHHRGQLTTLLTQLGLDVGPTDMPKM